MGKARRFCLPTTFPFRKVVNPASTIHLVEHRNHNVFFKQCPATLIFDTPAAKTMAEVMTRRGSANTGGGQEAGPHNPHVYEDEYADELAESRSVLEDSGCTKSAASEDEEEVDGSVLEDMQKFEESFKGITKRYRLINRIGEGTQLRHSPALLQRDTDLPLGTFSTVYKAEDLTYHQYQNDWDLEEKENQPEPAPSKRRKPNGQGPHYVAIKKIYVTSSPVRIMNELELLHDLRHSDSVCPLITAFRHQDQVIAILPYFRHLDFRAYFRDMNINDMKHYFRSLMTGLAAVHERKIIHRDIKPTNFLYDVDRKQGVLVDFGLAERQGTDAQPCVCQLEARERQRRIAYSYNWTHDPVKGYPKEDRRACLRANRAGTRGFRAPEVLFKCTAQTTKIDVWSAGIMVLTILAKRFPFFQSSDDIDAVIEMATIFGNVRMAKCALLHGQIFETNLPTITENGYSLEKIVLWATDRNSRNSRGERINVDAGEKSAIDFMNQCLSLDPDQRISARAALEHPFLRLDDQSVKSEQMDVDRV